MHISHVVHYLSSFAIVLITEIENRSFLVKIYTSISSIFICLLLQINKWHSIKKVLTNFIIALSKRRERGKPHQVYHVFNCFIQFWLLIRVTSNREIVNHVNLFEVTKEVRAAKLELYITHSVPWPLNNDALFPLHEKIWNVECTNRE